VHKYLLALLTFVVPQLFAADVSTTEQLLATVPEELKIGADQITAPDGTIHEFICPITWSPDGTQVAYVAGRGGMSVPVVGNKMLKSHQFVNQPAFGPAGKRVFFSVGDRTRNNKAETWWLVDAEGKRSFKQDWLGRPYVSPDGSRLAIWTHPGAKIARTGAYKGGGMVLAVGALKKGKWKFRKGQKQRAIQPQSPFFFTPDSKTLAVIATSKGEWFILLAKGKKQELLGEKTTKRIEDFALSNDGKKLAIAVPNNASRPAGASSWATSEHTEIVFGKNIWGNEYDSAAAPIFSPNGKHLGYKVQRDKKMGIAIDGDKKVELLWDQAFQPVFSPDSKLFAYVTKQEPDKTGWAPLTSQGESEIKGGKTLLIVEKVSRRGDPETRSEEYLEIRDVTWHPDGELIGYRAKTKGGWIIVCGDKKSKEFEQLGPPRFTADGKKLCFGARSKRELWWKVLEL